MFTVIKTFSYKFLLWLYSSVNSSFSFVSADNYNILYSNLSYGNHYYYSLGFTIDTEDCQTTLPSSGVQSDYLVITLGKRQVHLRWP